MHWCAPYNFAIFDKSKFRSAEAYFFRGLLEENFFALSFDKLRKFWVLAFSWFRYDVTQGAGDVFQYIDQTVLVGVVDAVDTQDWEVVFPWCFVGSFCS